MLTTNSFKKAEWIGLGQVETRSGSSHSRFLHILRQGAMVRQSGTRVVVTHKQDTLAEIPAIKLQGIVIYGNAQVSSQCLRMLMEEGVWLAFFSRAGLYKGRIQPPAERGGSARRAQYERSIDPAFALGFSKAIVRGKILAQRSVAAAYARNYPAESLGDAHTTLRASLERVPEALDLAELRGIEGAAARAYFDLFRRLNRSDIPFENRQKRPASDPVNALLNLGYSLLLTEIEGLIEAAGLDPATGFYHAPDPGRPSLACDLMEEFRHMLVDRMVLTLLNLGSIRRRDFEERPGAGGIRLKPDAFHEFVGAWERTMTACDHPARLHMLAAVARLVDAVAGRAPYLPHIDAPDAEIH